MSKLKSLLLGAVSAASLFVTAAFADVQTIYRSGAWETIAGRTNDGAMMCGVGIRGSDKLFLVKWFSPSGLLAIHMYKQSWHIPPGTHFRMSIQFDQYPLWEGLASAYEGGTVELQIAAPPQFLDQLRLANNMVVRFPDGNETPWAGPLTGSNAAVSHMASCIQWTQNATNPTQPFTSLAQPPVAPTQPFAGQTPTARRPAAADGRNI